MISNLIAVIIYWRGAGGDIHPCAVDCLCANCASAIKIQGSAVEVGDCPTAAGADSPAAAGGTAAIDIDIAAVVRRGVGCAAAAVHRNPSATIVDINVAAVGSGRTTLHANAGGVRAAESNIAGVIELCAITRQIANQPALRRVERRRRTQRGADHRCAAVAARQRMFLPIDNRAN